MVTRPLSIWLNRKPAWLKWSVFLSYALMGALMVVWIVTDIFRVRFTISASYGSVAWPSFAVLGFAAGCCFAFFNFRNPTIGESPLGVDVQTLLIPFCSAALFHVALANGLPIAAAVLMQHDEVLIFSSNGQKSPIHKNCPDGIILQELGVGSLCRIPDAGILALPRGQKIAVYGYGTSLGIFWTSIEPLPN